MIVSENKEDVSKDGLVKLTTSGIHIQEISNDELLELAISGNPDGEGSPEAQAFLDQVLKADSVKDITEYLKKAGEELSADDHAWVIKKVAKTGRERQAGSD